MVSISRLLLLLALVAAALPPLAHGAALQAPRNDTLASCSWDRPGRNPFMGDVVAAVDRYRDIPTPVREKLKQRMRARQYDDLVDIRRDEIKGQFEYAAAIRDMHFGQGRVCRTVTRERWTDRTHERGLVYCESEQCILVPTVCRNVSRVDRKPALVAGAALDKPPETVPAMPLASAGREAPTGAAAPGTDNAAAAPEPITSSFAEAVAGASIPLLAPPGEATSPGSGSGLGDGGGVPGGDGQEGNPPAFPPLLFAPGGPGVVRVIGGPGGGDTPPGGDGGGGGGGGGTPVDPGTPPPVTPVPEPSTWASLLAGLGFLAWMVARQRRAATGTPKWATQKRS